MSKGKPLSSLNTEDVVLLMRSLNIDNCEEMIRRNLIDGSALAVIESSSEFSYLGLILDDSVASSLYDVVQGLKKTGVTFDKSQNIGTSKRPSVAPSMGSSSHTSDTVDGKISTPSNSYSCAEEMPAVGSIEKLSNISSPLSQTASPPIPPASSSPSSPLMNHPSMTDVLNDESCDEPVPQQVSYNVKTPTIPSVSLPTLATNYAREDWRQTELAPPYTASSAQSSLAIKQSSPSSSTQSISVSEISKNPTDFHATKSKYLAESVAMNQDEVEYFKTKANDISSQLDAYISKASISRNKSHGSLVANEKGSTSECAPGHTRNKSNVDSSMLNKGKSNTNNPTNQAEYNMMKSNIVHSSNRPSSRSSNENEDYDRSIAIDTHSDTSLPLTRSPTNHQPINSANNLDYNDYGRPSLNQPQKTHLHPAQIEGTSRGFNLQPSSVEGTEKTRIEPRQRPVQASPLRQDEYRQNHSSSHQSDGLSTSNNNTRLYNISSQYHPHINSTNLDMEQNQNEMYNSDNYVKETRSSSENTGSMTAVVSIQEVVVSLREAVASIEDCRLAERALGYIHLAIGGDPERQTELGRVVGVESSIVRLLKHNIKNEAVSEYGCRAISALAVDNYEIALKLGQAGVCPVLTLILQEHSETGSVAEAVCLAIKDLAVFVDSDNATELGTSYISELLVTVFKLHIMESNIIKAACMAVRALAYNIDNRIRLVDENICDFLVAALHAHVQIAGVAEAGALAIFNICLGEEGRQIIGDIGGCEAVIKILRLHITLPEVVAAACRALCMLAQDNIPNKRRMDILGVCDLLTVSLRNHAQSPQVAEAACFAVKNLCSKEDMDNLVRFGSAGVCSLVVNVLIDHIPFASVVKSALFACANLALHPDNMVRLGESGVCEAVVGALDTHAANTPRIAEAGCQAIYQLSFNEANRADFGDCGGCELVVGALKVHNASAETSAAACRALCILAFKHTGNKELFHEFGACEALVAVMKLHKLDSEVVEWACQAASNLCVNNGLNQDHLGEFGACHIVVDLLVEYSGVISVVEAVLRTIAILAEDNVRNVADFYSIGVCDLIIQTLKAHVHERGVVEWSVRSIINLSQNNTSCKSMFGVSGACKVIVVAIKENIEDANICTWGWRAIHTLTYNDYANTTKFSVTKAHEYVVSSLTTHDSHAGVSEWACKVVSVLATYSLGNSVKLAATGACAAVVRVLWNHVVDVVVAEAGCRAVAALADDDVENAAGLCANSACEAVMHAITLHGSQVDLAEIGCKAISNLVANNTDNLIKIGDTGACDTILGMLVYHQQNSGVVTQALHTLCILASENDNRLKLLAGGTCKMIMLVLKTHLSSLQVCSEACKAICVFAIDENDQLEIRGLGATRLLMEVIVTHISDPGLIVDSFKAICAIGEIGRGKVLTIDPVLQALNTHISHTQVASQGCKAVHFLAGSATLTADGKMVSTFEAGAAQEAVVAALAAHTKDPKVAFQACRAICTLTALEHNPELADKRFGNIDSCQLFVNALEYNVNDANVGEAVGGAINNICASDTIRTILGDAGACENLVLLLVTHRANTNVVLMGCTALYNLTNINVNKNKVLELDAKKLIEEFIDDPKLSPAAQDKAKLLLTRFKSGFLFW